MPAVKTLEVAQHTVPLGDADGNVGIEVAGPQYLDDRRESNCLLDVASGLDDADASLGPDELRGQPALADAGIADHRDQPGGPRGDRVIEGGL